MIIPEQKRKNLYWTVKELLDVLSVLVPVISALRISNAIVCMSCPNVPQPHSCTTVENCGPNSYCFTELDATAGGKIYFNVGCKDKLFCHQTGRRRSYTNTSTTIHLDRDSRDTISCQECCDSQLCNSAGCTAKGFISPRGPICYACSQHKSQRACNQIQVCGRDEYCYVEKYQYGSDYLYNTACMTKTRCGTLGITQKTQTQTTHTSHAGPILGRSVDEIIHSTESESVAGIEHLQERGSSVKPRLCCTSDLCNTNNSLVPVDGHWSAWSSWTACSVTCGSGSRSRTRLCNNPTPKFGGRPCSGSDIDRIPCTLQSCSATPTGTSYTCLSCSAAASPRDCNFVQQCGPNSVCYLEKHLTTGGYFTFYSGCRDRQFCKASVGKRDNGNTYNVTDSSMFDEMEDNLNKDKKTCTECCTGDLCNSKGCGEPGYPSTQGPVCYKCDQQTHPDHCNQITICHTDEACHLTHSHMVGLVYSTGCIKRADCAANGYLNTIPIAGRMVGRRDLGCFNSSYGAVSQSETAFQDTTFQSEILNDRDKRTVTPCSKCCTSNLCNKDSCQHVQIPTTSTTTHPLTSKTTPSTVASTTAATQTQSTPTSVPTSSTSSSSHPHFTRTPPKSTTSSTRHVTKTLTTHGKKTTSHQPPSTASMKHVTSRKTHTTPTSTHHITSHSAKVTTQLHSSHQTQHTNVTTHKSHVTTSSNQVTSAKPHRQTTHGHHHTNPTVTPHSVSSCHHWASWTITRTCNEARALHIGYIMRKRICLDDNNYELDKKYCGLYTTKPCVPASIDSITVTIGSWKAGGAVNIKCNVRGDPVPTVKWSCSNDCGNLGDLFEYDYSIYASGLTHLYSGTYTCIADNSCGHATKDYVATVT